MVLEAIDHHKFPIFRVDYPEVGVGLTCIIFVAGAIVINMKGGAEDDISLELSFVVLS